jgi:hypothetical protein
MVLLMPDSPALPQPSTWGQRLLQRFGKSGVTLLAVMVIMLASAVAFTIKAEKPWGKAVQKRMQKQEPLKATEYAIIGLWWGAVVNAGVLAVLLGTAGRWMPGKGGSAVKGQPSTVEKDVRRASPEGWMWILVLGAVVLGAWERWPKLSQSYWNDEAYALNRFVRGDWEKQKDGRTAFEPVTWTDTLFFNRNANNHVLNSVLSRVSLNAWQRITGARAHQFRESVTRMPGLLAGLGTIFLMFILGREMGAPVAGVGAAWLLALHPWHIRYAVEMRGYSLMLFFMALALLAVVRALRTNQLRWWLVFAASEALFLLSFPGALYVALMVNVICAIELPVRKDWGGIGRLAAFNALGAVPVIQLMLPSVPQVAAFLRREQPAYVTDVWQWLHDLASVLVTGWQFDNPFRESHVGTDWKGVAAHFPAPAGVVAIILAALFIIGVIFAMLRGTAGRVIIVAPVLAALVSLAMNLRPGSPMSVWYLIFLLIPVALALYLPMESFGRGKCARWVAFLLCTAFTVMYGLGTRSAAAAVRHHDRQPTRQTVAFIHEQAENVMTATFGMSKEQHTAYDGHVVELQSAAELESCIAGSRSAAVPLYIFYCSDEEAKKRQPQIYDRLMTSGEFERVKEFPGTEELWSYRVYRLKTE